MGASDTPVTQRIDTRTADPAIAALAARQHGLVHGSQLRRLGLSPSSVAQRVAAGRLHRIHFNVFAVGHPVLTPDGRYMAAAMAGGRGAVISHRSAAALWGLRASSRSRIDITGTTRGRASGGIDVHRSRTLTDADRARVRGIPCTSVARTLVDLAEVVDLRSLERALEQAEVMAILDGRALRAACERAFGRHGASKLRALLEPADDTETLTRSELEERFLALCDGAGVRRPRVNVWMTLGAGEEMQVDFLWDRERLIAETDGQAAHGTRQAFERDRRRDQVLQMAGFRVVRFTWRQVVDEPGLVRRVIAGLLSSAA